MRAVIFMAVLLAVFIALLYIVLAKASGGKQEIREERVMTDTTPVPAPAETWTRYDVDLDDGLQRYIGQICRKYEVSTALVMAVIEIESGCDPACVGDNGHSYGLMQIYLDCHRDRCLRLNAYNLFDPRQNVLVGVDFLAELLSYGHGEEWALSWYNGLGGDPGEYTYKVMTEAERLLESSQQVTA